MVVAVIVAAGSGRRMGGDMPKQYLPVAGLPILVHTLRRFAACDSLDAIGLVVPPGDHSYCREQILPAASLGIPVHLAGGGERRQDSVANGLAAMGEGHDDDLVVIHDGVRPTVLPEDIDACVAVATVTGACILGQPAADTLKQVVSGHRIVSTIDRRTVWRAQTPQVFKRRIISEAHLAARSSRGAATDDSALVESIGVPVSILQAGNANIKVTTPQDLDIAAAILKGFPVDTPM
jgi:2-C-methyl-D-erythritol 4-phosphate cytidylyltransferase